MVGIVRVFSLTFIDVIQNLKYEYGGQIMKIFEIGDKSYTFSSSKFSELFCNSQLEIVVLGKLTKNWTKNRKDMTLSFSNR